MECKICSTIMKLIRYDGGLPSFLYDIIIKNYRDNYSVISDIPIIFLPYHETKLHICNGDNPQRPLSFEEGYFFQGIRSPIHKYIEFSTDNIRFSTDKMMEESKLLCKLCENQTNPYIFG